MASDLCHESEGTGRMPARRALLSSLEISLTADESEGTGPMPARLFAEAPAVGGSGRLARV